MFHKKRTRQEVLAGLLAALLLLSVGCGGQQEEEPPAKDDPTVEEKVPGSDEENKQEVQTGDEDEKKESGTRAPVEYTEEDIVDAYINDADHLILEMEDKQELDTGLAAPQEGGMQLSHSVIFKDYDGTVLKSGVVLLGQSAVPPADPEREGYTFVGWSGSCGNVREDRVLIAQYQKNEAKIPSYVVTFVDRDGTVLQTQVVREGEAASVPPEPSCAGFVFTGWDKDFSEVRKNMTVTAQYQMDHSMVVYAERLTAAPGDTVVLPVRIGNNAGVLALHLLLQYDESGLELVSVENGEAFSMLDLTAYDGKLVSGSAVIWSKMDIDAKDVRDGEILRMTFRVPEDAQKGNYPVSFVCKEVFDRDLAPLELHLAGGSITVE